MPRSIGYNERAYYGRHIEPKPAIGLTGMVFMAIGLAVWVAGHGFGLFALGILLMAIQSATMSIARAVFHSQLYGMEDEE